MIVVLPVCPKDIALAEGNLEWCRRIEDKVPYHAVISAEQGTDTSKLFEIASKYFVHVHHYTYDKFTGDPAWPQPQNYAWQTTARFMELHFREPWLWWEADVTVLKPGAFSTLDKDHVSSGMSFSGHIVKGMGHMNGVAIYPYNVAHHSTNALICRAVAFDVMLWNDIKLKVNDISHLIAHFPRYNGIQLSFNDPAASAKLLDKGYVLFHGCNDGSLIELLKGQVPKQTLIRKLIRLFKPEDVGTWSDESETMWQWEGGKLQDKGYSVLPYEQCVKPMPSLFKQTKYPSGMFPLPLSGRECHFNCSILKHNNQLQLITRRWLRDNKGNWHSSLVAWKLDEELFPHAPTEIRFPGYSGSEQYEDPRAMVVGDTFWVSHCIWRHDRIYRAHQAMSAFTPTWQWRQTINAPYGGNGYYIGTGSNHEKNWVWFRHDNAWHFVYSWQPHTVIRVVDSLQMNEWKTELKTPIPWEYGEIRGGTPPVLVGEQYVSFFHSSLAWRAKQKRYYMGAYSFEAKPPFKITAFTRKPILSGSEDETRLLGGPLTVFPCGSLLDKDEWLITFGINDEACGWLRMPHNELLKRLEAA